MEQLLQELEELRKSPVKNAVGRRIKEFEAAGKKNAHGIFSELCFCILTANFNAEKTIRIQREMGCGFLSLPEKKLAGKLKALGHRYPNARASYIAEARGHCKRLPEKLRRFASEAEARNWLADNVKGLGYKEASHFLRNIGFRNLAIIDFHIVDLLARRGLIEKPKSKSLTRKRYLEIERLLGRIAEKAGLSLAELDLYLWFMETGKILK